MLAEPRAIMAARGDGRLHVTFVGVGQGDSAVVRFPRGSTMVVEAGGLSTSSSFDIGDRAVATVLREASVRRLQAMVLTHGDPDHIGWAASPLREFRPAEVWEGIPVPRFEPLDKLRQQTHSLGSRWATVYAGDRVNAPALPVAVDNGSSRRHEGHKGHEAMTLLRVASTLSPEIENLVRRTIGTLLAVHRELGSGMSEGIYRAAAQVELTGCGIPFESERTFPVRYRGHLLGHQRVGLLVGGGVIVEIKSVEQLHSVHVAQVISYLRVTGARVGLLVNFNVPLLKQGIRRIVT